MVLENAVDCVVPTGNPLVVNCMSTRLEPVPTNLPCNDTAIPVTVAPAGTTMLVPPANSGVEF